MRVLDEGPYAAAWRRHRWWSRAFWITFLLYLPVFSVGLLSDDFVMIARAAQHDYWSSSTSGFFRPVPLLSWSALLATFGRYGILALQAWSLRCPRCGEPFFYTFDDRPWRMSWRRNPFARRCMHCGLPKWGE